MKYKIFKIFMCICYMYICIYMYIYIPLYIILYYIYTYIYIYNTIMVIKLQSGRLSHFHYRHRLLLVPKYMNIQFTVLL